MKTSQSVLLVLGVVGIVGPSGCGKSEPVASAPAPAVQTPAPAATPIPAPALTPSSAAAPALSAVKKASDAVVASLNIPDFQTATVEDISEVASQALTSLSRVVSSTPAVVEKVTAVKTALEAGEASNALTALTGLSAAAKNIPGAANLTETAKQLVSAWALKQGFDTAKISGVLGALQKKDYAALASQATSVLSKGGLTGDQQGLIQGVLNAYGIDATKAAGAFNAVKGLMGN
ncbi:MAG: hypothetical protein ABW223_09715 [Rariglobus sp.]